MNSRISYNVIPTDQGIPRKEALKEHLDGLKPTSILVIDDTSFLQSLNVPIKIFRSYGSHGDENNCSRYTPKQWLDMHVKMDDDRGFWHTTVNEPGFDSKIIQWHIDLIGEIDKRIAQGYGPLRIVGLNLQVGFPKEFGEWQLALKLLELAADRPTWVMIGFHEYGAGVLFSGVKGGSPNEFYHNGQLLHRDYIPLLNWPTEYEFASETLFHCGRHKEAIRAFKAKYPSKPLFRRITTEHGIDRLNDIGFWLNTLILNPGYPDTQGWKTLQDQWVKWWGLNPELAYFMQLIHMDEKLYRPLGNEGQLIFTWGASSPRWKPFDVSEAMTLQDMLQGYHELPSQEPEPDPVPMPVPDPSPKLRRFFYDYVMNDDTIAGQMEKHFKLLLDTMIQFKEL